MKQFNGFEQAQEDAKKAGATKLPAGAYVCKILGVKFENGTNGNSDYIKIQFDITEGEYAGFFKEQYDANTSEDKKFKGQTTIWVPADDGSQKDGWTKTNFAKWTNAFEASNKKYSWDWDETKWKGLEIGIVFGETGTVIDGNEVKYTEPRFPVDSALVREGNAPEAKFKAKNGYTGNGNVAAGSNDFMSISPNAEEEIPFN